MWPRPCVRAFVPSVRQCGPVRASVRLYRLSSFRFLYSCQDNSMFVCPLKKSVQRYPVTRVHPRSKFPLQSPLSASLRQPPSSIRVQSESTTRAQSPALQHETTAAVQKESKHTTRRTHSSKGEQTTVHFELHHQTNRTRNRVGTSSGPQPK